MRNIISCIKFGSVDGPTYGISLGVRIGQPKGLQDVLISRNSTIKKL